MALYVPDRRLNAVRSAAEDKVLDWLGALDDDWTVLHSVGLATHEVKPWAEADVVLVGPPGLLVLEVKGGRLERRRGMWGFRDRYDRVTWKHEGPYEQAGSAAATLRRSLIDAGVIARSSRVHWAVLLPDVVMPYGGPDVLPEVTMDASRIWGPPDVEVEGLLRYWQQRHPHGRGLEAASRTAVVERIRGDLSLPTLPSITVAGAVAQQLRLTQEQRDLLDAAEDNARLLVAGRAGTGKSALAVELARRESQIGRRVAYVAYNAALARRATAALDGTGVDVTTVDALALRLASQHDASSATAPDDADGWRQLRRRAADLRMPRRYDALLIDEAQDLDSAAGGLLDSVLVGGLTNGWWRAFHDPGQDIFGRSSDPADFAMYRPAHLRLTRNCRSTREITSATSLLCRLLLDIATPVQGPEVDVRWWSTSADHDDEVAEVLRRKVADYGRDHVLLVGLRGLNPERAGDLAAAAAVGHLQDVRTAGRGPFLATTSSVKGLEAVSVVVHGVDDLASEWGRRFLYTACSRASVDLTVLLHRRTKAAFDEGGRWFGAQLAEIIQGRRPG